MGECVVGGAVLSTRAAVPFVNLWSRKNLITRRVGRWFPIFRATATDALPPEADIFRHRSELPLWAASLDHVVGDSLKSRWNGKARRGCGLVAYDQFKLGGLRTTGSRDKAGH
jgi:hypothetical protein